MTNKNKKQNQPTQKESEINLKGTFISVMLLGVFILVLWFGSYALFLSR
ncbi:cytochrome c oxidase subunit 2A [Sporosarcina thermotolerans]|uniref:Cytochrome c oxidase subunit 2A n=1 Tax=Sporosarcina thermotolerans TaxID=633404 RepID=A0AAW9A605_9BACL|nr:cytochrome c oxidase subunit 2A [Sporosarcina thermotolerans]MDW0116896.1 cytochrome c oxidase subunit 2A [Sporosarcina thermotolerans]WHT47980.1 cytochrome c oxidase subunit 2A [Sporosarcina thermotolerans]